MGTPLAQLLAHYLANQGWSFEKLAEAAGLPRNTVYRWTRGEVKRIRHWQDLASAARALALSRSQADSLLQAGGHPTVAVLLERATTEEDRNVLARWTFAPTSNLPAQLTTFVGREQELAQLTELLSAARLVTLTGAGGSGKTRLALEVAQAARDRFEELCFVDLASIREPDLVMPGIARALGLIPVPDEPPLVTLQAHLRDKRTLLVLDNVEQVLPAAPQLTALLAGAPGVKALVTSRTRLNVRGEHAFHVHPLPVPDPASSVDDAMSNPAVTLFANRARALDAVFALSPGNAPLVARICAQLEGLPLGIELAAARTRQVPLGSMLERFPKRLVLASQGPSDAPDRQRTVASTIGWSYDLLGRDEQQLFDCLGVFVGGFTREAAESVAATMSLDPITAADGLESLVEQSLLGRRWGARDEPRYEMLETIREYALERLTTCGTLEAVANAAASYYLGLAERAELAGGQQPIWLRRLSAEHSNVRATLGWCRDRGRADMGLRLSIALSPMWQIQDRQVEAHRWLRTFMAAAGEIAPNLRARGLLWQGLLLIRQTGDDVVALSALDLAFALFRDGGDRIGMSEALYGQGDVYRKWGEWKRAGQRYAESLELARQTEHIPIVAHGWMGLALCAHEAGQIACAQRYWELTLEWAQRAGNEASQALAMNGLGEMARHRGDWEEADLRYTQALTLARQLGSEYRIALAQHNLAYVAMHKGELERASTRFANSLSLYLERRFHKGIAECLAGLGRVAALEGAPIRAARLCGATEAILQGLGTQLDTLDRADYECTLGTLRDQLGERLEPLLESGRAMSMDTAVALAQTCCRPAGR